MQRKRCDEPATPTRPVHDTDDESAAARRDAPATAVLRLLVRNHPGVMSHVCGLFHRRLFNVDGIACLPTGDPSRSAVLLLVRENARLEQVVRQLAKLADVLEVRRDRTAVGAFAAVADALGCPAPTSEEATPL